MKSSLIIVFGLLFVGHASAQNLKLDVIQPSIDIQQDSTIVTLRMTASVSDMNSQSSIRLTPVLSNGSQSAELPTIVLNGKKAQSLYRRNQVLQKRKKVKENLNIYTALAIDEKPQSLHYRVAIPAESWMSRSELRIKKEAMNAKNEKIQNENIPLKSKITHSIFTPQIGSGRAASILTSTTPPSTAVPSVFSGGKHYKGSFISPESDATDERNQKELNFSLDEARVMAEVNPQILSLRELYTVALSYKAVPEQFYKMIEISVKMYPASPIANLNAAAAAIEQGDIHAAGRYLQMASHKEVAYMNCRGVYELLSNNTYEGIRLLKAAKTAGSEEAAQNLKLFFEANQLSE